MIHQFTTEEKTAIRAKCADKFGGVPALVCNILAPIDTTIVVAAHDRKSYGRSYDNFARDAQTGNSAALMGRLLYPGFVEVDGVRSQWATTAEHVAKALEREAGWSTEAARVRILDVTGGDSLTRDDGEDDATWAGRLAKARDLPAGLSYDEAQRQIAGAKGRRLWAVELASQGLSCLLETPEPNTYLAARTLYDDAVLAGKGIVEAMAPYIEAAIKWSAIPMADLLNRKPALLQYDLRLAYLKTGGDGAAVRTFHL